MPSLSTSPSIDLGTLTVTAPMHARWAGWSCRAWAGHLTDGRWMITCRLSDLDGVEREVVAHDVPAVGPQVRAECERRLRAQVGDAELVRTAIL